VVPIKGFEPTTTTLAPKMGYLESLSTTVPRTFLPSCAERDRVKTNCKSKKVKNRMVQLLLFNKKWSVKLEKQQKILKKSDTER